MKALLVPIIFGITGTLAAQQALPPLPDSTGWGVHALVAERDPAGSIWVGTYGRGMYRLRPGATAWESIHRDSSTTSISFDFIHAFGFGPRGEIWYGTVGNGWGLSVDDGRTWKNWTFTELGPEWQYVAPRGIITRGDTTYIGTADGMQVTTDDGAHWVALIDSVGPAAKGPADTAIVVLRNEYVLAMKALDEGVEVVTRDGAQVVGPTPAGWSTLPTTFNVPRGSPRQVADLLLDEAGPDGIHVSQCGIWIGKRPRAACLSGGSQRGVKPPARPLTTWFRRPIDSTAGSPYIDQTYRYGSTMGGYFQQHQGVEFNNPDGTPVHAIGDGTVVYAGRAEAGALTVAIRHDTSIVTPDGRRSIYSVYYHNSSLIARVGDRVKAGDLISRVGNTGRATNDHLHLEVHASPTDSVGAMVDSLNKYPRYTTNTELWIAPLPGTGMIAGQVWDALGKPVLQARIYGLSKSDPRETPFSFVETYGSRAHSHPLYQEHFAVSDVPPGVYSIGVQINGHREIRKIRVEAGKLTWIEFRLRGR
ncbi:MAG: M23 family metallopeptidase [Gemmatimonadota bacterium]